VTVTASRASSVGDPFGRPGALAGIVDAGKRLQGNGLGDIVGERAAKIVPVATHGERGRADRTAEVEGEDLGARVAAKLQAPSAPAARSCRRQSDPRFSVWPTSPTCSENRNGVEPSVRAKKSGGACK